MYVPHHPPPYISVSHLTRTSCNCVDISYIFNFFHTTYLPTRLMLDISRSVINSIVLPLSREIRFNDCSNSTIVPCLSCNRWLLLLFLSPISFYKQSISGFRIVIFHWMLISFTASFWLPFHSVRPMRHTLNGCGLCSVVSSLYKIWSLYIIVFSTFGSTFSICLANVNFVSSYTNTLLLFSAVPSSSTMKRISFIFPLAMRRAAAILSRSCFHLNNFTLYLH